MRYNFKCSNELAEMLEWMRWSHAAYENDKEAIATKLDVISLLT